jgi:hypothetical protein
MSAFGEAQAGEHAADVRTRPSRDEMGNKREID